MLHRVGPTAVELTPGERVSSDTRYLASYRNLDARAVHLLTFAVDAANTVHWLYPAYRDAAEDPVSLVLPPAQRSTPLSESVILDHPAPGPLRLITIMSARPRWVSVVEELTASELKRDALETRFADDVIREVTVVVDAPQKVSPP